MQLSCVGRSRADRSGPSIDNSFVSRPAIYLFPFPDVFHPVVN